MSRSKGQKARRSRNNDTFKLQSRKYGIRVALETCDLRGVQQVVYDRAYREYKRAELIAYANQPSAYRPKYEEQLNSAMGGVCRLRQTMRKMKLPLTHVRVITRLDRKVRNARRHYRAIVKQTDWSSARVDIEFAKHFPREWIYIRDESK